MAQLDIKKVTTHPDIAHPFGNPPTTPTMNKGIPTYSPLLVKVYGLGVCSSSVCWNNLRLVGHATNAWPTRFSPWRQTWAGSTGWGWGLGLVLLGETVREDMSVIDLSDIWERKKIFPGMVKRIVTWGSQYTQTCPAFACFFLICVHDLFMTWYILFEHGVNLIFQNVKSKYIMRNSTQECCATTEWKTSRKTSCTKFHGNPRVPPNAMPLQEIRP